MFCVVFVFFFKQKTAYEMRISDWSSDVCSSDLLVQSRVCSLPGCFRAEPVSDQIMPPGCYGADGKEADRRSALTSDRQTDVFPALGTDMQIGRAPVCTPVTNAHLLCRLLLEKKNILHII